MKDLEIPVKRTVFGEVVKMDEVLEALRAQLNGDARVVTIQDVDNVNHTVWFSENQMDEFNLEAILFVGNIVSVDIEERVADVTKYETADGGEEYHTQTLLGGLDASHASKMSLLKAGLPMDFCSSIEASRKVVAEKASVGNSVKTVTFGRAALPTTKPELKALIADVTAKRDKAPEAYKPQYDKRIAELEKAAK